MKPAKEGTLISKITQVIKVMGTPMKMMEIRELVDAPPSHISSQLHAMVKQGIAKREKRTFTATNKNGHIGPTSIYVYWIGGRPDNMPGSPPEKPGKPDRTTLGMAPLRGGETPAAKKPMLVPKEMLPTRASACTQEQKNFLLVAERHFKSQSMESLLSSGLTPSEVTAVFTYLMSK